MCIVSATLKPQRVIAGLIVFGAILIGAILLTARVKNRDLTKTTDTLAATDSARVAYLEALGWEVDDAPLETLSFALPDPLSDAYLEYNELQRTQGFDLMPYAGKAVDRYSYAVRNYPGPPTGTQADLYLHEDHIIAGDILCCDENGFVAPLRFP